MFHYSQNAYWTLHLLFSVSPQSESKKSVIYTEINEHRTNFAERITENADKRRQEITEICLVFKVAGRQSLIGNWTRKQLFAAEQLVLVQHQQDCGSRSYTANKNFAFRFSKKNASAYIW